MAQSVTAVKQAGGTSAEGKKLLGKITKLTDGLKQQTDKLQGALAHESSDAVKHAKHFRDAVIPAMTKLRGTADELETIIPQTSGRSRRIARCCFK